MPARRFVQRRQVHPGRHRRHRERGRRGSGTEGGDTSSNTSGNGNGAAAGEGGDNTGPSRGGQTGAGGSPATGGSTGTAASGNATTTDTEAHGIFGLVTGGGGCACRLAPIKNGKWAALGSLLSWPRSSADGVAARSGGRPDALLALCLHTLLPAALLALTLSAASGCTTQAACFRDCNDGVSGGSVGTAGDSVGGTAGSFVIGFGGEGDTTSLGGSVSTGGRVSKTRERHVTTSI